MTKTLKFKGHKVTITRDRIAEEDRDPDLVYYEIRADDERPFLPIVIESTAATDFWGTMIAEQEIEFNNGEFQSLNEDLGMKLARGFGLVE
ncbi:hypothetical protein OS242_00535 [Tumebacillus sp. DT12]|uniref:Large polyvalent protein associated domain-containing protein n=1 Tax=Tumebacillus lacus TaxID=2995335 RepID=A0ABT3X183_9BACL|nr:LPD28 domain-containing protein [Tumebacillus lacus]MCX7568459.1 hypothetical protein [Tumebacillus lacus]